VRVVRVNGSVGVLVLSRHIETSHALELVSRGGFGYLLKDRVLEVGEFLAAARSSVDLVEGQSALVVNCSSGGRQHCSDALGPTATPRRSAP
jgi:hypothetical protein